MVCLDCQTGAPLASLVSWSQRKRSAVARDEISVHAARAAPVGVSRILTGIAAVLKHSKRIVVVRSVRRSEVEGLDAKNLWIGGLRQPRAIEGSRWVIGRIARAYLDERFLDTPELIVSLIPRERLEVLV